MKTRDDLKKRIKEINRISPEELNKQKIDVDSRGNYTINGMRFNKRGIYMNLVDDKETRFFIHPQVICNGSNILTVQPWVFNPIFLILVVFLQFSQIMPIISLVLFFIASLLYWLKGEMKISIMIFATGWLIQLISLGLLFWTATKV